MRTQSEYTFECAGCGDEIVTHAPAGTCPKCGAPYSIDWQGAPGEERAKK